MVKFLQHRDDLIPALQKRSRRQCRCVVHPVFHPFPHSVIPFIFADFIILQLDFHRKRARASYTKCKVNVMKCNMFLFTVHF